MTYQLHYWIGSERFYYSGTVDGFAAHIDGRVGPYDDVVVEMRSPGDSQTFLSLMVAARKKSIDHISDSSYAEFTPRFSSP
ncbi:MAG: hypothetical protein WC284_18715 [Candidimonas sp.]